jgi:vancomycin permeability regulator SanA
MATKRKMKTSFRKVVFTTIGFLGLWFLVHSAYITFDGLSDYKGKADVAIILGNTVFADSSLSPWLKARVDKAFELYKSGRVRKIFASGGLGEYGVAEGDAMKWYLEARGVPAGDIFSDNNGKNTYMTAIDFIKLNQSFHFSSATVVTSFYHITRSKYIIRKEGFSPVYGVGSGVYFRSDLLRLVREFFAFYKYAIFY